jgi:MFS family permease
MKIRYLVLLMLVLLSIITYLDRICIGVAGSAIQADLGISDKAWGWVLGAFLLSYGIFEIPSGAWGDRFGQRKVLTRIVLWWSLFTALTPLARNYYVLVATRFLFGAGEAGAYPNASGCISRWFPLAERARAQGMVWGASRLGGALTPLLVIPLINGLGWQACFWLFGGVGVIWAVVWAWWFRDDPADHSAVSESELAELGYTSSKAVQGTAVSTNSSVSKSFTGGVQPAHLAVHALPDPNPYASPTAYADVETTKSAMIPPPGHSAHVGIPWAALFASPQLWLIVAMYFFYVFGFIFFMFWLPKFLTQGRGMSQESMGTVVALMFTSGAFGNFVGGWTSDWLSKHFGLAIGRKFIGVTCLALSGLILFAIAFTHEQTIVATLVILCFGITDGMLPCSWAICLDVGKRYSGAVSGAMNSAGQAAGYICTVLLGYLVTWYGNYDQPLLLLAPSLLISAILFALIDPTRPLVPDGPASAIAE